MRRARRDRQPAGDHRSQLDARASGAAIHGQVEALLQQALSIYRVDASALRDLHPDVIVTQTQCEVCAVSRDDVERALAGWTGATPQIVALSPMRLDDIFADIARVASAIGRPREAAALTASMRRKMDEISQATAGRARPRVATLEWLDPPMAGGNWMPELIALAGGENLFGAAGRHSPWLEWDAVVAADPDIILVLPCGFSRARGYRKCRHWHYVRVGMSCPRCARIMFMSLMATAISTVPAHA